VTERTRRWLPPRRGGSRDERPLLVRAREQPELFGEFFAERHEQVLAFFARRVLDPETAFDLMAETFAAAFASLGDFRGTTEQEGHAWLWAIARNLLYRWRERGQVERRSLRKLGIDVPAMSAVEFERAEELADFERVRPRVAAALEELSPDHREAVRQRVVEERGYPEIAEGLGVSETVVRARVSRGLRRLAVLLEQDEAEAKVGDAL
jgi:RNA polymerase sigma-70 factor (ECF subfamily)